MKRNIERSVRIVEIKKGTALSKLKYQYVSNGYYDVSIIRNPVSWITKLTLEHFEKPFEKVFEEKFFEKHVEEPKVFTAEMEGKRIGWLELGYERWNNRCVCGSFQLRKPFGEKA